MSELLNKIKSRAFWEVTVSPAVFQEKRIENIMNLKEIVYKNAVRLRGWDFPHYDFKKDVVVGSNWVGQEFEWEHYLESWRIYQSGQFIHFAGLSHDWRDQSSLWPKDKVAENGNWVQSFEIIYRISEIFEFASRLSQVLGGGESIDISISLNNVKDRSLLAPNFASPFITPKTCGLQSVEFKNTYSTPDLISKSKDLAINTAIEIYRRFNWDTKKEVLVQYLGRINQ